MSSEKEHPLLKNFENRNSKIENFESPKNWQQKMLGPIKHFCEKQLSPGSVVTRWVSNSYDQAAQEKSFKEIMPKKGGDPQDLYHFILSAVLTLILIFSFFVFPGMLKEIDQLQNDLEEQAQVIEVETKNKEYLDRLEKENNILQEKINTVDEALPHSDERAERMISDLELIARQNNIGLDSISINEVSDSQFYNDDLAGTVRPYEYNFSVESSLSNITGLVQTLRNSLRIMDIMTIDIERGEDAYTANISLFAYHLIEY